MNINQATILSRILLQISLINFNGFRENVGAKGTGKKNKMKTASAGKVRNTEIASTEDDLQK